MIRRSANYASAEVEALICNLEMRPDLISTNNLVRRTFVNIEQQKRAWEEIADAVNSTALGYTRTTGDVKRKWMDLKSRVKAKAAKIFAEGQKSGGGGSKSKQLTELEERVLNLIGNTCVMGVLGKEMDTSSLKEKASHESQFSESQECPSISDAQSPIEIQSNSSYSGEEEDDLSLPQTEPLKKKHRTEALGMGFNRSAADVKRKWLDLKFRVKLKADKSKKGPNKLTSIDERILKLMGNQSVLNDSRTESNEKPADEGSAPRSTENLHNPCTIYITSIKSEAPVSPAVSDASGTEEAVQPAVAIKPRLVDASSLRAAIESHMLQRSEPVPDEIPTITSVQSVPQPQIYPEVGCAEFMAPGDTDPEETPYTNLSTPRVRRHRNKKAQRENRIVADMYTTQMKLLEEIREMKGEMREMKEILRSRERKMDRIIELKEMKLKLKCLKHNTDISTLQKT